MFQCFFPSCSSPCDLLCHCTSPPTAICSVHISSHLTLDCPHPFETLSHHISHEEKLYLTAHIVESIRRLHLLRAEVQLEAKASIEAITAKTLLSLENIRKQEALLNRALERIAIDDKIEGVEAKTEEEEFILQYLQEPNAILKKIKETREWMINEVRLKNQRNCGEDEEQRSVDRMRAEFDKNIQRLNDQIRDFTSMFATERKNFETIMGMQKEEYEKRLNNLKNSIAFLKHMNSEDIIDEEFPPKRLFYLENGTKNLCCVNPFAEIDQKVQLKLAENLSLFAGLCEIEPNKLFYYGGTQGTCNYTFIIDNELKTIVKREPNKPKSYIGICAMINGFVYIFGGYLNNSKYTEESEKYYIPTDQWFPVTNLPIKSAYNSCVSKDSEIFITGYQPDKLYIYDTKFDAYTNYGNFTGSSYKVLCLTQGILYVFDKNKVYKSEDGKVFAIVNQSSNLPNNYLITCPVRCGKGIYFVLEDTTIYRFDLSTETISMLRKVKF
jgi:hypothetical protein